MSTNHISMTPNAAARIVAVAAKNHQPAVLRVAVNGGGCSGFQYEFSMDEARSDDDIAIEQGDATLLIDSISLVHMSGSVVDFIDDLMGQSFRITNPLAKTSCGCGTSFSL